MAPASVPQNSSRDARNPWDSNGWTGVDRRQFLAGAAALGGAALLLAAEDPLLAQQGREAPVTHWEVSGSEGLDAIAFTGALAGEALYVQQYGREAAEFGARLPAALREDLAQLAGQAGKNGFGLFWPTLALILSGADTSTIDAVIASLADLDGRVRPALQATEHWDAKDWAWLSSVAPRLHDAFSAMRDAGFTPYRKQLIGSGLDVRAAELTHMLGDYDVIRWQRKLSGKTLDPKIAITLLYFSKPHGVRVQGQRFLQAIDYSLTVTLRTAAHELFHPPLDMDGPVARRAIAALGKDSLIDRIVREHDPRWGYRTLSGYVNEDICQALDQMVAEALGFARNPADRWRRSDDGMHVLAAGLYALLRQDRWQEAGGSIEQWLDRATRSGLLFPSRLHPAAARVLERPLNHLWPLAEKGSKGSSA